MYWEKLKTKLFYHYLVWRGRPARLKRALQKKVRVDEPIDSGNIDKSEGKITAAALQVKMKLYHDPVDFATAMMSKVGQAVAAGAELIVFPEYNLMQLIGMLPGMEDSVDQTDGRVGQTDQLEDNYNLIDVLRFISPLIKKISQTTFSEIAKHYQIHIMTGTGMILGNDKQVYNSGYLFGPSGQLLGEQQKLHLMPVEEDWGLAEGRKLEVVTTGIGKLAFPVCMDATYFETFRIARNKGAEIVMIPIANPDPEYNYWAALRGIWPRVQESGVYGIKSAMVGEFLNFSFTGQAGIYAPLEMTKNGDGILAEASSHDQEEIVTAELDLQAIHQLERDNDHNQELWDRYFPGIYYSL